MADADPFLPPARPIRAVSDLDHWQPGQDPFNVASVPLRARPGDAQHAGRRREGVGKVLVCHDMAGGYKADALPQGYLGYDATTQYSLQYWMLVDQFIYFSHERFSVPPSCWTNAAHRHGATFIAEWEQGILETLKLIYGPTYNPPPPPPPGSEIRPPLSPFPTAPISDFYIHKMVGLALYYGFDGWFLNVESDLACTTHADALRKFVESLTQAMHKAIPGSLVQWYDSVTITGRLRWQDHLNVRNAPFFRSCDSIFVNYTWKEDFPLKSAQLAASIESNGSSKIGQNPRDRTLDVFTGIDVWGRNTFGGGGFNVHKALRKISTSSTSVAIFAPGWTYETFPHEQFGQIDRRFWFGVPRLLKPTFPPRNPNEPPPTTVEDENGLFGDV
ncbi:glycosyl hydrolase family 85-domain-containing protein [Zopfochytrium polystomum]|nr:glycosyl hydrolase family 85-domain-containing protein [Zopfochytrium polystomum]